MLVLSVDAKRPLLSIEHLFVHRISRAVDYKPPQQHSEKAGLHGSCQPENLAFSVPGHLNVGGRRISEPSNLEQSRLAADELLDTEQHDRCCTVFL